MRDRTAGNLDLAMQEFNDFLRYFSATELAPNAQFYVGMTYYDKGDMESAIRAFDLVLEKYRGTLPGQLTLDDAASGRKREP